MVRIVCINKDAGNHANPHEAISHYGWINEANDQHGRSSRKEMVDWIKMGGAAYVKDQAGMVYCKIKISITGTEFLQTVSDGRPTDNLLYLPECK